MAITIEQREHLGAAVLVVTGRMTLSECRGRLTRAVRDLVERGRKHVVLDLEAVPFLDSAGLGELVGSHASLTHVGGSLKLAGANHRVRTALEAARLSDVMQFVELPALPRAAAR